MRSTRLAALTLLAGGLACSASAATAGETRGFVVSWFVNSSYSQEGDCPDGINWSVDENLRRIMKEQGKSDAEIAAIRKQSPQGLAMAIMPNRGRIDGKPVNVYLNPTSVPDPGANIMKGKASFGFNLDGKDGDQDFRDPETGEDGVDNRLFRAIGCFTPHRATPPDLASLGVADWDMVRDAMPAWLVEISGVDDRQNDDEVQVGVFQAQEPIMRSAAGGGPESDMTYRVDPNPRHQNLVRGRIKDGVITTDPFALNMMFDPESIPEYYFRDARLRLRIEPDGTLRGILGGYHDWKKLYWGFAATGVFGESVVSMDMPAIYYLLRKLAEAYPDPKTGENTAISASYELRAVPAFVVRNSSLSSAR